MCVLGHRFHSNAADFFQCFTAHDGTGAAEHRCVPCVIALLNEVMEERVLIRNILFEMQVLFKRVLRVKVMRRLHQSDFLVL